MVADVIAGQADYLLGEEGVAPIRKNGLVGDDIVDEACAGGTWITQIINLQRGRSVSEDPQPPRAGVRIQIDENIDTPFMDQFGGFTIGSGRHVEKFIDGTCNAPAFTAGIVFAGRHAEHREFRSIVKFEQSCH